METEGNRVKYTITRRMKATSFVLRVAAIPTAMTRCFDYLGRNRPDNRNVCSKFSEKLTSSASRLRRGCNLQKRLGLSPSNYYTSGGLLVPDSTTFLLIAQLGETLTEVGD
jgi:hypothetical protein